MPNHTLLSLSLVLLGTSISSTAGADRFKKGAECKAAGYVEACQKLESDVNRICRSNPRGRASKREEFKPTALIADANLQVKVAAAAVAFDKEWSRCYGTVRESECSATASWVDQCGAKTHDKYVAYWTEEMTWLKDVYLPGWASNLKDVGDASKLEAFVKQAQEWNRAMPETMRFKDESMFPATLEKTAAAKRAFEEKAAKYAAEEAAAAKARKLPKPALREAKLEKAMAAAIKNEWKDDEILKVVITAKGWTKHVNQLGVLQDRKIATTVVTKQKDGCRMFEVNFIQRSPDARTFGPTQYYSVGDSNAIACENVK